MNGTEHGDTEYRGSDGSGTEHGGKEHRGGSASGERPRRHAASAARPIGWLAADRILKGRDGGVGTEDLRALIAVASASTSSARADGAHGAAESERREAMLSAFRESAATAARSGKRSVTGKAGRSSAPSFSVALRFATAVLIVCGVGVGAASAGVLPEGMQRIAHDYLGIGGMSAPSTHVPSSSAATSGAQNNSGNGGGTAPTRSMTPNGAPTSPAAMAALCEHVSEAGGKDWQAGLSAADQATLIAAAGEDHKVKGYCAKLLASAGKDAAPTPGATTTPDKPSSTPSVDATATHGNAHVSHSPDAHGNSEAH